MATNSSPRWAMVNRPGLAMVLFWIDCVDRDNVLSFDRAQAQA